MPSGALRALDWYEVDEMTALVAVLNAIRRVEAGLGRKTHTQRRQGKDIRSYPRKLTKSQRLEALKEAKKK